MRRQETRSDTSNKNIVVAEREGARVGATGTGTRIPPGIDVAIGFDTDIVYAEPAGMARLAHFTYWLTGKQRRLRSVDYFIDWRIAPVADMAKYPVDPVLEAKVGIRLVIPRKFKRAAALIRGIVAAHVRAHLGPRYVPEKLPDQETSITFAKKLVPPAPSFTLPATLREGSKQKGKHSCGYDLEIDLFRGCPAATTVEGFASPELACGPCYGYSNKLGVCVGYYVDIGLLQRQYDKIKAERRARGMRTEVLCIGMMTDPGHKACRAELIKLLVFCTINGVTPVLRSKFLEYDSAVSALLKHTGGVLVVSLGSDTNELGAVGHGRTQAVRIRDGRRYLCDGVNVAAGVIVDPAQKNGGALYGPSLKKAGASFPYVIMFALRAPTKKAATAAFGTGFKTRTTPTGLPMYESHGGEWVAAYVHPTIARLIGNNRGAVRLCLKSAAGEYCGACFVPGEAGTISTTASAVELAPLAKTKSGLDDAYARAKSSASSSSTRGRP